MKPKVDCADFFSSGPEERLIDDLGPTLNLRTSRTPEPEPDEIGDVLVNCRIVAKLGYGSSGQAYLAEEIALANRLIVLKVGIANHEEHLNLARLQHTHIMPLFWTRTVPRNSRHVLAMPYLAKTTLATLMRFLQGTSVASRTGQNVFDALQADQEGMPVHISAEEQPTRILQKSTWVEFTVRMGLILAEALAYAHQRNLLHLDVKPANIVLTPDGQPILLDLDVARSPLAAGETFIPWLGGTPAFMSPEQREAMTALEKNRPIPQAIDGRSDLYSLGLVLYQVLGGICDSSNRPDAYELPCLNPNVNRELAEILARCLAQKPEHRYPDGKALAEDLGRYLHDLPLHGVRNRLADRWRKWRRRRPLGLPFLVLFAGFCFASGLAGANFGRVNEERRAQAEVAMAEGLEWQRQGQHDAAMQRFLAGKNLAEMTMGGRPLRDQLAHRLHSARRLQAADELNRTVHLMRFCALQEQKPRRLQHVLDGAGKRVWEKRALLTDRSTIKLDQVVEKNIESQLQELVLLWSDLRIRLAPTTHKEPVRADVRSVLEDAEALLGASFGLQLARAQADGQWPPHEGLRPQAAWEFCALGRVELANGNAATAGKHFQEALKREPLELGSNLHVGVGFMHQKRYAEAAQAFSYCLGKDPSPECLNLRAQTYFALGEFDLALRDFGLAIEKDPDLAGAYQHRGNALLMLGRFEEAARDFARARTLRD